MTVFISRIRDRLGKSAWIYIILIFFSSLSDNIFLLIRDSLFSSFQRDEDANQRLKFTFEWGGGGGRFKQNVGAKTRQIPATIFGFDYRPAELSKRTEALRANTEGREQTKGVRLHRPNYKFAICSLNQN